MTLATRIRALHNTFQAWSRGEPYPSPEAWMQFGRDLREASFEAACQELGIDTSVIDIAVAEKMAERVPSAEIIQFPDRGGVR